MQLIAKLIELLPVQTGEGRNGPWKKTTIIVETMEERYPRKICISAWGDRVNENILNVGNLLDISFDIESREYNGKWYTDVKAWKIELANSNTTNNQPYNNQYQNTDMQNNNSSSLIQQNISSLQEVNNIEDILEPNTDDDLPF